MQAQSNFLSPIGSFRRLLPELRPSVRTANRAFDEREYGVGNGLNRSECRFPNLSGGLQRLLSTPKKREANFNQAHKELLTAWKAPMFSSLLYRSGVIDKLVQHARSSGQSISEWEISELVATGENLAEAIAAHPDARFVQPLTTTVFIGGKEHSVPVPSNQYTARALSWFFMAQAARQAVDDELFSDSGSKVEINDNVKLLIADKDDRYASFLEIVPTSCACKSAATADRLSSPANRSHWMNIRDAKTAGGGKAMNFSRSSPGELQVTFDNSASASSAPWRGNAAPATEVRPTLKTPAQIWQRKQLLDVKAIEKDQDLTAAQKYAQLGELALEYVAMLEPAQNAKDSLDAETAKLVSELLDLHIFPRLPEADRRSILRESAEMRVRESRERVAKGKVAIANIVNGILRPVDERAADARFLKFNILNEAASKLIELVPLGEAADPVMVKSVLHELNRTIVPAMNILMAQTDEPNDADESAWMKETINYVNDWQALTIKYNKTFASPAS